MADPFWWPVELPASCRLWWWTLPCCQMCRTPMGWRSLALLHRPTHAASAFLSPVIGMLWPSGASGWRGIWVEYPHIKNALCYRFPQKPWTLLPRRASSSVMAVTLDLVSPDKGWGGSSTDIMSNIFEDFGCEVSQLIVSNCWLFSSRAA